MDGFDRKKYVAGLGPPTHNMILNLLQQHTENQRTGKRSDERIL